MKIYIDFDDVICETGRYFATLVKELFGVAVPYEEIQFFNLQKAFGLNDSQYAGLMTAGHTPETLLAYAETPGASHYLNQWLDKGHEVAVITGRPFSAYEPSRQWLDAHGLQRLPLFCVDKYGREKFAVNAVYSLSLEELYKMEFDFAVEDSPTAFSLLLHFPGCITAVFDRPWNQRAELPDGSFFRCHSWQEIDALLTQYN